MYIYDGEGTNEKSYVRFSGSSNIPLIVSSTGPLTIKFKTDYSVVKSGFQLIVDCTVNFKTIYYLIKNNNCRLISCKDDWKNLKNIILSHSGLCVKNCNSTSTKYHYKGNCYTECPENTTNFNYICYSNSIIEKCEIYSLESNHENLCIKCQNNYYPKLNDFYNN